MASDVFSVHDTGVRKRAFDEVGGLIETAETSDDNVSRFLGERICCNGVDCGCHGATVGEYLAYQIRALR